MEFVRRGKCINFGNDCAKADRGEVIELSVTEDFVCPDCGRELEEILPPKSWWEKNKKWVIPILAILILGGAGYCIYSCPPPPPPKVIITPEKLTVKVDASEMLTAKTNPEDNKSKWNWKSDKESIAKVNDVGVVTGVSEGSATITATHGRSKASASVKVIVEPIGLTVDSILMDKTTLTLRPNQNEPLSITILPENAANKNVEWKSSDESIATVNNNGVVAAVKTGKTVITVRSLDGSNKSAERMVEVRDTPPPCRSPRTYSFGRYEGAMAMIDGSCVPEGQGTMYYRCRVQIAKHGRTTYFAEDGDTFVGTWGNGDIVNGNLYDRNNNQKAAILAGKRPNRYDLSNDRCAQ